MSMVEIARFLEVNQSVDGVTVQDRWFSLPRSRWAARSRLQASAGLPAFVENVTSLPRDLGSVKCRGIGGAFLF